MSTLIDIAPYVLVGFVAQLVDGAIGMAYGVISTAFLLSIGITPASASAAVHMAEIFTTGVSGGAHLYHRNVEKRLVLLLLVPGVIGASLGAYVLTAIPGHVIKPYIAVYLMLMGLVIIWKVFRTPRATTAAARVVMPLGLVGAFLDSVGGGGWGPVVGATLIAKGLTPRFVIGSVIVAEFFVTLAASATFVATIGVGYVHVVGGLIVGGVVAAPLAAYLAKRLPVKAMMVLVGLALVAVSGYMLLTSLR